MALDGIPILKPTTCIIFVPSDYGESLTLEQMLQRLKVSSKKLQIWEWMIWGLIPTDNDVLLTFVVDNKLNYEHQRLNLKPYFNMEAFRFCMEDKEAKKEEENEESDTPTSTTSEQSMEETI